MNSLDFNLITLTFWKDLLPLAIVNMASKFLVHYGYMEEKRVEYCGSQLICLEKKKSTHLFDLVKKHYQEKKSL